MAEIAAEGLLSPGPVANALLVLQAEGFMTASVSNADCDRYEVRFKRVLAAQS